MPNKTTRTVALACIIFLSFPVNIEGGTISYYACMATVGVGGAVAGPAILGTVGFTSAGIASGSWAASWMAAYGGAVPAGSLFATLQSSGAGGITWAAFGGISGFCDTLMKPFP